MVPDVHNKAMLLQRTEKPHYVFVKFNTYRNLPTASRGSLYDSTALVSLRVHWIHLAYMQSADLQLWTFFMFSHSFYKYLPLKVLAYVWPEIWVGSEVKFF